MNGTRPLMRRLARWHIWLGWAAGVPLVLWTASGLFMAARPIEEVRGQHLRATPAPVDTTRIVLPDAAGPVSKLELVSQRGARVWIVTLPDKARLRFSAENGRRVPAVSAQEARDAARAALIGQMPIATARRFTRGHAPLDLRSERAAWQIIFADGTQVYVDADTGEVMALRTRWWRIYDTMWGLHIMDLQTRENSSHGFLWVFGAIALLTSLIGTVLLFRRRRPR